MKKRMRGDKKAEKEIDTIKRSALEDSERAYSFDNDPSVKQELALCLFANSATVASEKAERGFSLLQEAYDEGAFLAGYELVRQHGFRNEHQEAVELFKSIANREYDKRRFHSNINLFAYSMLGLYYKTKDYEKYRDDYILACEWLKEVIQYDRHTAMNVVDCCELMIICGYSVDESLQSLDKLKLSSDMFWDQIISLIDVSSKGDTTLADGLLIGLENPDVWNRIGTVYYDFTDNYIKAIEFYDRAARLDYNNPVYHLNKARVLIDKFGNYSEGERVLWIAKNKKKNNYGWYWKNKREFERLEKQIPNKNGNKGSGLNTVQKENWSN